MSLSQASTAPSIPDLIDRFCEPNPKERSKFICPVCGSGNLQIGKSGKWNCWNDPSSEHRSAIARLLNQKLDPHARSLPAPNRKSQRQMKQERDRSRDVAAAVALSEVEMKVAELTSGYDPAYGISANKLTAEMATWAKAHGHDVYAAKMLLKEQLRAVQSSRVSSDDEQCKLARSYHKIKAVWGDRIQFNERNSDAELDGEPIELDTARVDLAVDHNIQVGIEDFHSVALSLAKQHSYDPVAEYLTTVAKRHQGTDILAGLASRYFGTSAAIYETFIRKTLIAAVARVFKPGCSVQHALILQGKQRSFKSTFFKRLCGEPFFDDTMGSANDKDERLKLHRFWFIEWAELEALFRRKDISTVKAFITTASDNIRPPYGRQTATYHRRSIIVGTTNEDDFLRDPTGNRRFWVIPVQKQIPIDLLEQERDQIWAAAVHAYRAGEKWYLEPEEEELAAAVASEFEEVDPWESYIEHWLEMNRRSDYSTNEILEQVFQLEPGEIDRKQQMRVAQCMKKLGWQQGYRGHSRKRVWCKKNLFLPELSDQVDLPNPKPLVNMNSCVDQPVDRPVDQPVDRPLANVDQPPNAINLNAQRLIYRETQSGGGSMGGVDRPDQPICQNFKVVNLQKGEAVEVWRKGWQKATFIREAASMALSPFSKKLELGFEVVLRGERRTVSIDCVRQAEGGESPCR